MQEYADAGAPVRTEGMLERAVDWVFGYDFFLSYSHGDGMNLPRRLKERLEQLGFRVFLDQTDYVAGVDLRRETKRQVLKSRRIVIVARPYALQSQWVKREVDVAVSRGMVPVLLNINGALEAAPPNSDLAELAKSSHWLHVNEKLLDADQEVSDATITELNRSFTFTRQETRRRRLFAAAAVMLALTTIGATSQAIEANRQRAVALRNFEIAKRSADGLVTNLARELRNVEGMKIDSVRQILDRAETAYSALADASPRDVVLVRGRSAMYAEFVETFLASGDTASAERSATLSVKFARQLVELMKKEPFAVRQLGLAEVKLGDVMTEVGNFDEARAAYLRALGVRKKLAADNPKDLAMKRDVAVSLVRLGSVAENAGDISSARKYYEESLSLRRPLAVAKPAWRRDIIVNQMLLSDVYLVTHDIEKGLAAVEEAIALAQTLSEEVPTDSRYARYGAVGLQYRGNFAMEGKDYALARSSFAESLTRFKRLSATDPKNMEWRRDVGVSLAKLAEVELADGNRKGAEALLAEVVTLRRDLLETSKDNNLLRIDLAEALKDMASVQSLNFARPSLMEAREILQGLGERNALSEGQRGWIAEIDSKLGSSD